VYNPLYSPILEGRKGGEKQGKVTLCKFPQTFGKGGGKRKGRVLVRPEALPSLLRRGKEKGKGIVLLPLTLPGKKGEGALLLPDPNYKGEEGKRKGLICVIRKKRGKNQRVT